MNLDTVIGTHDSIRRHLVAAVFALAVGGSLAHYLFSLPGPVPKDEFGSAITAAIGHANEDPESTAPITAGDLLAAGHEAGGDGYVQVSGTPADGYCIRASDNRDGPWAYYDSTVGSADDEYRDAPPREGPCSRGGWKFLL